MMEEAWVFFDYIQLAILAICLFVSLVVHYIVETFGQPNSSDQTARPKKQMCKDAANARAQALLESFLTAREQRSLAKDKFLDVPSGLYPVVYRVEGDGVIWPVTVWAADGGNLGKICVMFNHEGLPRADRLLAHILNLRHDEAAYLDQANGSFASRHRELASR